jgi:hypothetical protein
MNFLKSLMAPSEPSPNIGNEQQTEPSILHTNINIGGQGQLAMQTDEQQSTSSHNQTVVSGSTDSPSDDAEIKHNEILDSEAGENQATIVQCSAALGNAHNGLQTDMDVGGHSDISMTDTEIQKIIIDDQSLTSREPIRGPNPSETVADETMHDASQAFQEKPQESVEIVESDEVREEREARELYETLRLEYLSSFQDEGLSIDGSDPIISSITNNTSAKMAEVLTFAMGMRQELDHYRKATEERFTWYHTELTKSRLAESEAVLRAEKFEEEFKKFKKRSLQIELRRQLDQLEQDIKSQVVKQSKELNKLREPDVTLEDMKVDNAGLRKRIEEGEVTIKNIEKNWEKEKESIKKMRFDLNKDIKSRKDKVKAVESDVKTLEVDLIELKEDINELKEGNSREMEVTNTWKATGHEATIATVDALNLMKEDFEERQFLAERRNANLQDELDVFRKHMTGILEDPKCFSCTSSQDRGVPSSACEGERRASIEALMDTQLGLNQSFEVFRGEQLQINTAFAYSIKNLKKNLEITFKHAVDTSSKTNLVVKEQTWQARRIEYLVQELEQRINGLEKSPVATKLKHHEHEDESLPDADLVEIEHNIYTIGKELSELKSHVRQNNVSVEHQLEEINKLVLDASDNANTIESAFNHKLRVERKERLESDLIEVACRRMGLSVLARNLKEIWEVLQVINKPLAEEGETRSNVSRSHVQIRFLGRITNNFSPEIQS